MKVSIIVLIYNSKKYIKPLFDAIFAQTHKDLEVFAVINASEDGSQELIQQNYPQVKILNKGRNLWFTEGNNLGIEESTGEIVMALNHDVILESNYVEEALKAFDNPKVAAVTGKLLRYDFEKNEKLNIIDSTGIVMSASGRAKDRGQLQEDRGQFDNDKIIFGVTGAAALYRRVALEKVKYQDEYFDEDFVAYWEDVDLSWRLNNAGFLNIYMPTAVAYHGRTAGQAKGGYLHLWHFIQHHKKMISPKLKQLNYKNHILAYIKNAKHVWHPAFIFREIAMLGYMIIFETSTLKVLPELFRQIPKIWKKRKTIMSC